MNGDIGGGGGGVFRVGSRRASLEFITVSHVVLAPLFPLHLPNKGDGTVSTAHHQLQGIRSSDLQHSCKRS